MVSSLKNEDFLQTLSSELNEIKLEFNVSTDKAFEIWSTYILEKLESYGEAYDYVFGGGSDKGIDAFIDEIDHDQTIRIIQAKYHDDYTINEGRKGLQELTSSLDHLKSEKVATKGERTDFKKLKNRYKKLMGQGYKVILKFVTLSEKLTDDAQHYVEIIQDKYKDDDTISLEVYTFKDLKSLYEDSLSLEDFQPVTEYTIIEINEEESFVRSSINENESRALVATVKTEELAKLLKYYKHKLFHKNVRYYMGTNTTAAKNMIRTIEDKDEAYNFWYYNNGVTIDVLNFNFINEEVIETNGIAMTEGLLNSHSEQDNEQRYFSGNRTKYVALKGPQVINGCQTTETLHYVLEKIGTLNDTELLVRFLATKDEEMTNNVCTNTNTQNTVQDKDIRSNDGIQKILQGHFSNLTINSISRPFFYITKKGEDKKFKKLNKSTTSKYKWSLWGDTKIKFIKNDDLAKAYYSYIGHPGRARNYPKKLFIKETGGYYDEIFKNEISVYEYLLPTLIYLGFNKLKNDFVKESETKLGNLQTSLAALNEQFNDESMDERQYEIQRAELELDISVLENYKAINYAMTCCIALVGDIFYKKYKKMPDKAESEKILNVLISNRLLLENLFDICQKTILAYAQNNSHIDFQNKFKEDDTLQEVRKYLWPVLKGTQINSILPN